MFVAELLKNEICRWESGDDVLIQAPTGSGKTTFILYTLLPYALDHNAEILYLSNRQILHKQVLKELCNINEIPYMYMCEEKIAEFDGITIMTYQTLQQLLEKSWNPVRFFNYIVADEIHYIVEDSEFNPKTERIIKWFSTQSQSVLIAVSATIDPALPYLNLFDKGCLEQWEEDFAKVYVRKPKNILNGLMGKAEMVFRYYIPSEQQDYKIFVYEDVGEIVEKINVDTSDNKWLIFQSNKEKAIKKIKSRINKKSVLLTADDKKSETMQEIIESQTFSVQVLLTTKVLDNGVSLHDPLIRNIVLDTVSKTEFLQMLGRKRRDDLKDCVNLYIPKLSVRFFENFLRTSIVPALELIKKPVNVLLQEMLCSEAVYSECKKYFDVKEGRMILNPIAEQKLKEKQEFCEKMLRCLEQDEFSFVKMQLHWLGMEAKFNEVSFLTEQRKRSAAEELKKILENCEEKNWERRNRKCFAKI